MADVRGSTAPRRRFAVWFLRTRLGMWLTATTARWQTIIAILVLASGYPLLIASIGSTNEHQRTLDQRVNAQSLYTTQLVAYANASNTYAVCLASAQNFAAEAARWDLFALKLQEAFASSPDIDQVAKIIRESAPTEPLLATDCPPPGDPPSPPTP